MKKLLFMTFALLFFTETALALEITEVFPNPLGDDNNKEFIEIYNPNGLNLSGYVIGDEASNDTLLGLFGISNFPTGDKDPYGLRRAALGLLRILIENKIDLDLQEVMEHAFSFYQQKLENTQTIPQVIIFIKERWRSFCLEKGISADVFASVAALEMLNPWDGESRMFAVQAFKKQEVAVSLAIANKRVHHILTQYKAPLRAQTVNPAFFEHAAEKKLAHQLEVKNQVIQHLYQTRQYDEVLAQLTELSQPIDDFFNQVMVMVEDQSRRENRILLLSQLRTLFLQVADITHLQYKDLK